MGKSRQDSTAWMDDKERDGQRARVKTEEEEMLKQQQCKDAVLCVQYNDVFAFISSALFVISALSSFSGFHSTTWRLFLLKWQQPVSTLVSQFFFQNNNVFSFQWEHHYIYYTLDYNQAAKEEGRKRLHILFANTIWTTVLSPTQQAWNFRFIEK